MAIGLVLGIIIGMVFLSNNNIQRSPITKKTVSIMPIDDGSGGGGGGGGSGGGSCESNVIGLYFNVGSSFSYCGKTIILLDVSTSSAIVDVGGVTGTITSNIKTINGLQIQGTGFFTSDVKTQRSMSLLMTITGNISNGSNLNYFNETNISTSAKGSVYISSPSPNQYTKKYLDGTYEGYGNVLVSNVYVGKHIAFADFNSYLSVSIVNVTNSNNTNISLGPRSVYPVCLKDANIFLNVGQYIDLCGKTIILEDVSSSSVVVNVNSVMGTLDTSGVKVINGIYFKLLDTFTADDRFSRSANLIISNESINGTIPPIANCTGPAQSYFMSVGQPLSICGKTVKLLDVSSASTSTVVIDVNGAQTTLSGSEIKDINSLEFKLIDAFYADVKAERSANIMIGPVGSINTTTPTTFNGEFKTFYYSMSSPNYYDSGNYFCILKGYPRCVSVTYDQGTSYYSSKDKTCNAKLQLGYHSETTMDCSVVIRPADSQCNIINSTGIDEPYLGDVLSESEAKSITCAR